MSEERRQPSFPRGGLQVARLFGVPIVIQPLWFVIVVVFTAGYGPYIRNQVPSLATSTSYAVALAFVLLLYLAVLVHELAHTLVARSLGMEVRRIVLQFLGGASEVVEEQPGAPSRDFLVAAAGPLTSVFLGGAGLAVAHSLQPHTVGWLLADGFGDINALVAGFNLLPGLPLDGGRLLRDAIWQVTKDKLRSTLASAWVGRALAIGIALFSFATQHSRGFGSQLNYGGLYLLVIAFFIWTSASWAMAHARLAGVLPRLDLRNLMRRALAVTADLPVAEAVRRARDGGARALVVVDTYGRPSGLVSEAAVMATPPQRQPWLPVSDLARPVEDGLVLKTDMSGDRLLQAVQTTPATEYLVLEPTGAIAGVLNRGDLIAALQAQGLR